MKQTEKQQKQIILLSVSGPDRPGLTSSLTGILGQYDVSILDIGQSDIHQTLNLAIVFEMGEDAQSAPLLKDILMKSYELGLTIKFTPLSREEYLEWAINKNNSRYIITVLGRCLTASQIHEVAKVIASYNLNIRTIYRLTHRPLPDDPSRRVCLEMNVEGAISDRKKMTSDFLEVSSRVGVDIAFQQDNMYYRNRRLVCFDMDSTLIQTEVIDELGAPCRLGRAGERHYRIGHAGEIDFQESFKRRIKPWPGLPGEWYWAEVAESLPLTEGAERLLSALKIYGYKTAIISGRFHLFRPVPPEETGNRLRLCQRTGDKGRSPHRRLRRSDRRWGAQGRIPAPAGTHGGVVHRTSHCLGRRGKRPDDAQYRRAGDRLSSQTRRAGKCSPQHFFARAGRGVVPAGLSRPPHRRPLGRASSFFPAEQGFTKPNVHAARIRLKYAKRAGRKRRQDSVPRKATKHNNLTNKHGTRTRTQT